MTDPVTRLNQALEGRYAVERELGQGGMATVYLARDLKHNRNVALKVLKPELAAVVGAERFLSEIETTAGLQHPHILPLFDSGEADGFLFYVMPYIEGETLRDRIDRERQLPVDEALDIATAVAHALQAAHDHGIVHRDIKPGNILMSSGEPMVSDFGIAIAVGAAGGGRLTETGLSVGTPYYMSPEQATGDQTVGPPTDIYALGCVLYEMMVGEPPYLGSTAQAVLGKIIQGVPVSATAARKAVPANVDAAIRKALEKLPADRFARATEFSKALSDQHFRWGYAAEAGAAGGSFWRPLALALGAVAAATTLGLSWALLSPDAPPPVTRDVVVAESFPLSDAPIGDLAAIAPDGSSMILPDTTSEGVLFRLALRERGSVELTPLPGTELAEHVVYSPDGQWIAYVIGRELIKRPISGGTTITLAADADDDVTALAWLDDGTIVYEREVREPLATAMVRIPEDGGDPLGVVYDAGEGPDREFPMWARGLGTRGLLLAVCANGNCAPGSARLELVDLEDGSTAVFQEEVLRAWYVETGHVLYVRRDGAVVAAPFDTERLQRGAPDVPLFEGVRMRPQADMVLGADGTLLYVDGGQAATLDTRLVWVDRSGREDPVDPGLDEARFLTVALSPDDTRLAVDILGESRDIWVKELPTGPMTRLTTDPAVERRPVWSLDGNTIAYLTDAEGSQHIRTVRSDGSGIGDFDVLVQRDRAVFEVVFAPEEGGLLFREGNANTGEADLGFLDLETGEADDALLASRFNERAIALSPDGRWLAYVSDVTGRDEVFVRPFPDTGSGQRQVSRNGGIEPRWAHNGRELFYREGPAGPMVVATYSGGAGSFEVTAREQLFDASPYRAGEGLSWHTYDVTGDDQRFIMIRPVGTAVGDSGRLILVRNWLTELEALLD